MSKRVVKTATVERFAKRSTVTSARLERRDVPQGFVRSDKVSAFLKSKRSKS